ncbi:RES family NAD+ phosphorylase [Cognatilysobacter lacus]|uniref:RES domain-containing protein n=1 Tax=Cognatilysobacter lacus TaxID=1643323 RepID=A0A5D8ZAW3_9GAMM|nr:RES domain-containing protein [Lysobacter lacus]TZF89824.1 RES domain-containing protein [Lysobacter lacus]
MQTHPPVTTREKDLDKALKDTFPASDPLSVTAHLTATPTSDSLVESDRSADHPGTVTVYRIVRDEQKDKPFAGDAADAGRWTSEGTPAIYATLSPGTALLEFLAHCDDTPPASAYLARAQIPVERIDVLQAYPSTWRQHPYRRDVQQVGDAWSAAHRSLAAKVPSAICEEASNLIINPAHVDSPLIQGVQVTPIGIDPRLRRIAGS